MQPHSYPGVYILIDGPEGTGKSTQVSMLAEKICRAGFSVVTTKEPGGTPAGVSVQQRLLSGVDDREEELKLFFLDRHLNYTDVIIPALMKGEVVICDRSSPSTIAYQHFGRGMMLASILAEDARVRANVEPDLTIMLIGSVPFIRERIASRGKRLTAFERENDEFHERVVTGFREMTAKHFPFKNVVGIDLETHDNPSPQVLADIITHILFDHVFEKMTHLRHPNPSF